MDTFALSENAAEGARQSRQAERSALADLAETRSGPDAPARWEAEHPGARENLRAAESAFKLAVERQVDRRLGSPSDDLVRMLGERPDPQHEAEREAWDQAARAVESHRIAHGIDPSERSALGSQPEASRGSWERRDEWRRVGERVLDARERLGIGEPGRGPVEQRLARVEGLLPDDDRERALDRATASSCDRPPRQTS